MLLVARRWAALIAFALTQALTPPLVNLIKLAVDRERPPGKLLDAHGTSDPSGHAAYAGATAVALVLSFSAPGPRRRSLFVLAAVAIAVMVWSRTYLQVHWLSDAVAGATLGIAVTLICFAGIQVVLGPHPANTDDPWLKRARAAGALDQPRRAGRAMSVRGVVDRVVDVHATVTPRTSRTLEAPIFATLAWRGPLHGRTWDWNQWDLSRVKSGFALPHGLQGGCDLFANHAASRALRFARQDARGCGRGFPSRFQNTLTSTPGDVRGDLLIRNVAGDDVLRALRRSIVV